MLKSILKEYERKSMCFIVITMLILCYTHTSCHKNSDDKDLSIIEKTVIMYAAELSKSYENHELNLLPHIISAKELDRVTDLIKALKQDNTEFNFSLEKISIDNIQLLNEREAESTTKEIWMHKSVSKNKGNASNSRKYQHYAIQYHLKKEKGIWKIEKVKMRLINETKTP